MVYCFICPKCNNKEEVTRSMKESNEPYYCSCGTLMRRDFQTEHKNVDGLMIDHPRYSISGAVLDEDLPAVRKINPHREWKKFGSSWRPLIRNRADKLKFLKESGAKEF